MFLRAEGGVTEKREYFQQISTTCSLKAIMEGLQGPIDPCLEEDHVDNDSLGGRFVDRGRLGLEEDEEFQLLASNLADRMPFLQMLQSADSIPLFHFGDQSVQALLTLHNMNEQPREIRPYIADHILALERDGCVTHEAVDYNPPVKSEAIDLHQNQRLGPPCMESIISRTGQEQNTNAADNLWKVANAGLSAPYTNTDLRIKSRCAQLPPVTKERKKRRRTKATKNKEEVENQRITHIAVERKRRRQMNDHLNSLRLLMPPSYVQRGDQASIIGGAIDFVKELELLLQSLEAKKRLKQSGEENDSGYSQGNPFPGISSNTLSASGKMDEDEAQVEASVIHNHVNLKVRCQRRHGQLLKAIVSLQEIGFTVLHLNITSSQDSMVYSFNLKMEEDFKLGSADEIATMAHHIFKHISGG